MKYDHLCMIGTEMQHWPSDSSPLNLVDCILTDSERCSENLHIYLHASFRRACQATAFLLSITFSFQLHPGDDANSRLLSTRDMGTPEHLQALVASVVQQIDRSLTCN
jgi:hypothetical protein